MIASQNVKVLVVDCDPQGDLTALLNRLKHIDDVTAESQGIITTASLFDDELKGGKALKIDDNLSVIIGTTALYSVDQKPTGNFILNPEKHLRQIMETHGYDVCVIDTPPTAGNRMLASQLACDLLVMPIELSVLAIRAISKKTLSVCGA